MLSATKVSDSSLSKEILECEFSKKFSTPIFDYYSGVSDLVQHIRHFWDKMVLYSGNDSIMCLTFPFSLKDVASDWFYSLPPHSFHNFVQVIEMFLTQYAFRWEVKKNNHHLLSVKMTQGDSLKSYISYF